MYCMLRNQRLLRASLLLAVVLGSVQSAQGASESRVALAGNKVTNWGLQRLTNATFNEKLGIGVASVLLGGAAIWGIDRWKDLSNTEATFKRAIQKDNLFSKWRIKRVRNHMLKEQFDILVETHLPGAENEMKLFLASCGACKNDSPRSSAQECLNSSSNEQQPVLSTPLQLHDFSMQREADKILEDTNIPIPVVSHAVPWQPDLTSAMHAVWNGAKMYCLIMEAESQNAQAYIEALNSGPTEFWEMYTSRKDFLEKLPLARMSHALSFLLTQAIPIGSYTIIPVISQFSSRVEENFSRIISDVQRGEKKAHVFFINNAEQVEDDWVTIVIQCQKENGGCVSLRMHVAGSMGSDYERSIDFLAELIRSNPARYDFDFRIEKQIALAETMCKEGIYQSSLNCIKKASKYIVRKVALLPAICLAVYLPRIQAILKEIKGEIFSDEFARCLRGGQKNKAFEMLDTQDAEAASSYDVGFSAASSTSISPEARWVEEAKDKLRGAYGIVKGQKFAGVSLQRYPKGRMSPMYDIVSVITGDRNLCMLVDDELRDVLSQLPVEGRCLIEMEHLKQRSPYFYRPEGYRNVLLLEKSAGLHSMYLLGLLLGYPKPDCEFFLQRTRFVGDREREQQLIKIPNVYEDFSTELKEEFEKFMKEFTGSDLWVSDEREKDEAHVWLEDQEQYSDEELLAHIAASKPASSSAPPVSSH